MGFWFEIAISVIGGTALGLLYFGGLWWTVNRIRNVDHAVGFYLASLIIRAAVLLLSLFWLLQLGIVNLFVAVIGFFAVRLVLIRRLGFSRQLSLKRKTGAT